MIVSLPPPQRRLSYACNPQTIRSSFSILLNAFHRISMAYSDNTNSTSFYPFYTSGEFDAYSSQASADEQLNFGTFDTPTNGWSMDRQSAYMVDSEPTGLRAEASLGKCGYSPLSGHGLMCASPESMSSTTPDRAQTYDNGQSSHPEHFWPIAGQDSQSDHSGIVGRDNSFATSVALEPSATIPTPSSCEYFFLPWDFEEKSTY